MEQDLAKRLAERVDALIESHRLLRQERDRLLREKQRWTEERTGLQAALDAILEKFDRLEG